MPEQGTNAGLAAAIRATEPARWLLATGIEGGRADPDARARACGSKGGGAAVAGVVERGAVRRAQPRGGRELVGALREGLQRLGLMHRRGVRPRVAVGADQHLTALHDVIQEAFGWFDDHLYSFWLNNEFHGGDQFEYTSPEIPDEGCRTADVPIAELDLPVGAKMAYVFDFGDNWRYA